MQALTSPNQNKFLHKSQTYEIEPERFFWVKKRKANGSWNITLEFSIMPRVGSRGKNFHVTFRMPLRAIGHAEFVLKYVRCMLGENFRRISCHTKNITQSLTLENSDTTRLLLALIRMSAKIQLIILLKNNNCMYIIKIV